ncbi:MAG: AraC family transcriptional regulator [Chitinophagaceae bacterium]|nr:AraC family transcriptional regulator [Chitinophagaceae bacterium]
MLLQDFIPAPDVREFVQLFRIVHFQFEKEQPLPFKAYPPRPEQCLVFYPFDTEVVEYPATGLQIKHLPVVLYGQFSQVTNRLIGRNFLVLQIVFTPGALYRLTGIPSTELSNCYIDAETYFTSQIRFVNERLAAAADYPVMLDIVTDFVRSLIKQQKKTKLLIDDACLRLLHNQQKLTVKDIAREACLSSKQLERKFKERTGVNPKLFERIIRFDKAFRLRNARPDFDWLRIAVECNYHDYQHLAKEYLDFTNLTPTAFHELENKAPERQFGLIEGYYE